MESGDEGDEIGLGNKDFEKVKTTLWKEGYRDGRHKGREEVRQNSFDKGFQAGFRISYKIGILTGLLEAINSGGGSLESKEKEEIDKLLERMKILQEELRFPKSSLDAKELRSQCDQMVLEALRISRSTGCNESMKAFESIFKSLNH